ncbi:adenylyl-sulfate kinase [Azospirillum lipoferum]|nr:adenylyl-sulfate kinase [Azospirillum lipoferum]
MKESRMFIHFDLPRAAGDSLMDCVERVYGASRVLHLGRGLRFDMSYEALLSKTPDELELIKNHYGCAVTKHAFALHKIIGVPYVGFVRNPFDWYISSYYWAKKNSLGNPSEFYGYMIDKHNMSLEYFVHWLHDIGHDNNQTKNIFYLSKSYASVLPPDPADITLDEANFAQTIELTETAFAVLAPTDLFGRALYVMGMLFDWPDLPLWRLRSSSNWRASASIPYTLEDFVRERSPYDWNLFATVRKGFEQRYADVLAARAAEIADYDACSRNPAWQDAMPFHVRDLPEPLLQGVRLQAPPPPRDPVAIPGALRGNCIPGLNLYLHGVVHGHFLLSPRPDSPPFLAVPLISLIDRMAAPEQLWPFYGPGVLFDRSLDGLRQRLEAGEVPSLVESQGDLQIWFYRGAYRFLEWTAGTDIDVLYSDPEGALNGSLHATDWPTARQFFTLFTDPFQRQRIDGFGIVEGVEGEPWRAEPTAGGPAVTAPSLLRLLEALQSSGRLSLRSPPPFLIDSLTDYNLVKYQGRNYGAHQGGGDLEDLLAEPGENLIEAATLKDVRRAIIDRWLSHRSPDPHLIETLGVTNIVLFRDRFVALPQALGPVDLSDPATFHLPGVIVSRSRTRLRHLVATEAAGQGGDTQAGTAPESGGRPAPLLPDASGKGRLFWLTGLSGAGKTTVALRVCARLRAAGLPAVLLDGDRLRAAIAPDAGHSPDQRRQLALSYARLCRELTEQGLVVVIATISMFHAVRQWNRENIEGYREIYLRVPLEHRAGRDPKGLYRNAAVDMVGMDTSIEEPDHPDLVIDNYGTMTPDGAADLIWDRLIASDAALIGLSTAVPKDGDYKEPHTSQ